MKKRGMTTVGVQFLCTKHIVSIVNSHHFCVFTTKNSGKRTTK